MAFMKENLKIKEENDMENIRLMMEFIILDYFIKDCDMEKGLIIIKIKQ